MDLRIKELEVEIERFKQEKAKVTELQMEYEAQLERVTKEIEAFEDRKAQELEEIQLWKQEQLDEIAREREELRGQREALEEEEKALLVEKGRHERLLVGETERLLNKIKELESDNADLNRKLDELTDKQYHCVGTQTSHAPVKDEALNTSQMSEAAVQKETVGLSPLKGILKNSGNSPARLISEPYT